jgi:hypothetical protein
MENMSNTNDHNPISTTASSLHEPLPPLPFVGSVGPDVCATIRLYLAVWQDLIPEQTRIVYQHVQTCDLCKHEQLVYKRATQLVQSLPASSPSVQIDRAVLAAIAAHNESRHHNLGALTSPPFRHTARRRSQPLWLIGSLAAAAMIVLAFALMHTFSQAPQAQAFSLPASLSWDNYVLFHEQISTDTQGEQAKIMSYHDMSKGIANIETVVPGKTDVVVVTDEQKSLKLDMMHHVAQMSTKGTPMNDAYFDLDSLRQDLHAKSAVYLGTATFKGQTVYRIRYPDGHVLLLDMNYMPVNVLPQASATSTPMYSTVQWLSPSKVEASMWDMDIPAGFKVGDVVSGS